MGRPPCCDKANVKRGLWTAEEDAKILAYVANHGTGNWTLVPKKAGLNRCGKSCRLRWTNYLRPDLKHESFSPQEEDLIVELHKAIGSRWSLIAKQLPGRTDNDVKNYWNTKLKKKLMKMGIDPITHKPFSQIFSDYNNVSCLTHQNSQIRSATRGISTSVISQAQLQPVLLPALPSTQLTVMPMSGHFHDNLVDLQAADPGSMNPNLFDEVSPASSCSSSSSSITTAQQRSLQIAGQSNNWSDQQLLAQPVPSTEIINQEDYNNFHGLSEVGGSREKEKGTFQYDLFGGSCNGNEAVKDKAIAVEYKGSVESEMSSSCPETSSFVKAMLDRDSELQLDLLALNEFLEY